MPSIPTPRFSLPSPDAAPAASAGPADCFPAWTLAPDPALRLLGGALSGGLGGLLVENQGRIYLLLVTEGAETLAVDLGDGLSPAEQAPPPAAATGSPDGFRRVGAVASGGNRFLAAYGATSAQRTVLRIQGVMPDGRFLPVNAPGRPGAAGEPVLERNAELRDGAGAVRLVALERSLGLAARPADPAAPGPWLATTTPSGAPTSEPGALARLVVDPAAEGPWLQAELGTSRTPWLAPLGEALLVRSPDGSTARLAAAGEPVPFTFEDGWVPAPDETVLDGVGLLARFVPGADGSAAGEAVAYGARGQVLTRTRLPAGNVPLAVGRGGRRWLVQDAGGGVSYCEAGRPESTARTVDWSSALRRPSDGGFACGR